MEIDFLKNKFTINEAMQLNPLVLAFIGDAIYEVFVRTYLVDEHRDMSAHKLHVKAVSFVKAHSQSELMKEMMDILTEEECRIFKRGRNAKSGTVPRNADVREYRMATGFEALMGFLYLTNQLERLNELMNIIVKIHK
ncbi:Mini-ribonuclease 3 [Clostridium botulinum]|uniref:Mini-ribonuclease 3 n=1 Tax=Clostridium botulinum C/D str. DC5 TaxID=1443128 RepID=A0A0A0IQ99_CLOBO|nr:Mini-ribonuclease 3 [Clostridium botulinum]KEI05052.1 Mini-ribonuclease 3 [Clostridium botulinum C/D str. BKT75002]KEI11896.1 Mini-ribonuclease 3 [Clostridium botulinum C/D str. BKT2873]KGM93905.1 Mini-ribonuclease 3 [Clostridium botulinum D str. CCUG 7971]KGN01686.1 Mini-ribonuclease 3 [Clostridium botulinum C/D str. DC5]KOC48831.1 Mini-ribonuclease 3 [Clostridium botulinum]